MSTPLNVATDAGDVVVRMDAATARQFAAAWSHFHTTSPAPLVHRRWHDDVVRLLTAAVKVDDNVPEPVMVPRLDSVEAVRVAFAGIVPVLGGREAR